jgi:hypothetical protein
MPHHKPTPKFRVCLCISCRGVLPRPLPDDNHCPACQRHYARVAELVAGGMTYLDATVTARQEAGQ